MFPFDPSHPQILTSCPACKAAGIKIIESRETKTDSIRRRRRACVKCGHKDTTYEVTESFFKTAKENKRLLAKIRDFLVCPEAPGPKENVNAVEATCEQCGHMSSYGCAFDFPEAGGDFAQECSMFAFLSDDSTI